MRREFIGPGRAGEEPKLEVSVNGPALTFTLSLPRFDPAGAGAKE